MALEDLKDSVTEQLKSLMGRVRESDAYLQLSERYHGLSPAGQKASLAGGVVVAFLIVMAVPYSFYSASQTSLEEYVEKRDVIRTLFKVNREASALPPAPPAVSAGELTNMARNQLTAQRLAPEQIVSVTEAPANTPGVDKGAIDQAGIQVSLAKLNLKQIVDLGVAMQGLQSTARMMGLDIKANLADPKYYDVIFKIVAYSAKPEAPAPGTKGKKK